VIVHNEIAPFNELSVVTFAGKPIALQDDKLSKEDLEEFKTSLAKWKEKFNSMEKKPSRKDRTTIAQFLAFEPEVDSAFADSGAEDAMDVYRREQKSLFNDNLLKPLPPPPIK